MCCFGDHAGIDQTSLLKLEFLWAITTRFWRRVLCPFHDGIELTWWRRGEVSRFEPGLIDDEQPDEAGDGEQNVKNIVTVHRGPIRMKSTVSPWAGVTKECRQLPGDWSDLVYFGLFG